MTQPTEGRSISVRAECSPSRHSPSYEAASARATITTRVTVQASDGNEIGYFEVTVDVTNVKEDRGGNLDSCYSR